MCELEAQGCENTDHDSDSQTPEKHQQENSYGFEETENTQSANLCARFATWNIFLCRLEQHNGNSGVQYRLSKDYSI